MQAHSWISPTTLNFKINVDSATFAKLKVVGIGVLVRDDQCRVIAALGKEVHAPLGAVEAEAKAFEEGMQFAKDTGIQEFIMEGDSLIIFRALSGLSSPPIAVDSVVQGLKSFSGEFHQISFSHVHHQGNRQAHLLVTHVEGIVDFSTRMKRILIFWNKIFSIMSFLLQMINKVIVFLSKKRNMILI